MKECARKKGMEVDLEGLLERYERNKELRKGLEGLRRERRKRGKDLSEGGREEKQEEGKRLRGEIRVLEEELREGERRYEELMLRVPNVCFEEVPEGGEGVVIRHYGEVRKEWGGNDHIEIGRRLGVLEVERGVRVGGAKSYYLLGAGAMLENAILQYALDGLIEKGYKFHSGPLMVGRKSMEGTGYFPDFENQAYKIEGEEKYLIGTSEVSLCGYHEGEEIGLEELPFRMVGLSNCFRREAGSYGKEGQGLYRVHQFQKVEQVIIGRNDEEESKELHEELLRNSEEVMRGLELPYRVIRVGSWDLGVGQVIKHDLEAWMPSRGKYEETHSCSTMHEFQSRRLRIRYEEGGVKKYVHTLNNTCIASPRILIPFLEVHGGEDGRIRIPVVLRRYMRGMEFIGSKV